jgi:hypothetical protein
MQPDFTPSGLHSECGAGVLGPALRAYINSGGVRGRIRYTWAPVDGNVGAIRVLYLYGRASLGQN